jgi:hypothetical protein
MVAICSSSCEASTSTEQRDAGSLICGPVPSFVEPDTNPGQATADRSACSPIIFSNAAGEDD